jgi:signal transduction histidine kinase
MELLATYSARLANSLEISRLVTLLQEVVLPAFLVVQAAIVRLRLTSSPEPKWEMQPILLMGVPEKDLPNAAELSGLIKLASISQPRGSAGGPPSSKYPWARLVLPLTVEGQMIGLCLLGRRNPDDRYAPSEIPLIQTLLDQTALALLHIEQTSRLRALYQVDIQRQEETLRRLARDLHDEVLGQMTLLAQSVNGAQVDPSFLQTYQIAVERIRSLISGLRPAAINYGLRPALEDLVDELDDQSGQPLDGPQILLNLGGDLHRYPEEVELQLYRIVQQACQNALVHAKAKTISISGNLQPNYVNLSVTDDGIGFTAIQSSELTELLAQQHYGLVGMHERAALIHARLSIHSEPGKGMSVGVDWSGAHPAYGQAGQGISTQRV